MYYEQYTEVTYVVVPCYIFTILVGTFGNGVFLHACFSRELVWQNKPYNLILSVGVLADLIICAIFTPLLLVYRASASARLIENSPLCEMGIFTSLLAVSLQYLVFPLLAISCEDFSLRPTTPWLNLRKCKKLLIIGGVLCAAVSLGQVVVLHATIDTDETPKLYRCIVVSKKWDAFSIYFLGYSCSLYVVSIAIAAHCYLRIHKTVSVAETSNLADANDCAKRARMCKITAVVYTLFWTPFVIVQLYGVFGEYSELVFNFHALSSVAGVMASAVNPYIYTIMDHHCKRKFLNIFKFGQSES